MFIWIDTGVGTIQHKRTSVQSYRSQEGQFATEPLTADKYSRSTEAYSRSAETYSYSVEEYSRSLQKKLQLTAGWLPTYNMQKSILTCGN